MTLRIRKKRDDIHENILKMLTPCTNLSCEMSTLIITTELYLAKAPKWMCFICFSWQTHESCGRARPCLVMALWYHRNRTHGSLNGMATSYSRMAKRQKALSFFIFPTRRDTYSLQKIWILEFSIPPRKPKQHSLCLFPSSRVNFNRKQHILNQAPPPPPWLLNVDQPCILTLGRYPVTSLMLFYAPSTKFYCGPHKTGLHLLVIYQTHAIRS